MYWRLLLGRNRNRIWIKLRGVNWQNDFRRSSDTVAANDHLAFLVGFMAWELQDRYPL